MNLEHHRSVAASLVDGVVGIIERRGDGMEDHGMLEYWLQAEIWRAVGLKQLPGFTCPMVGEVLYHTTKPFRKQGGTGFHWCDILLAHEYGAVWLEMKDLGRNPERIAGNGKGFLSKNLLPLAHIGLGETCAELGKDYDDADKRLRDTGRQEARNMVGKTLEGIGNHLGAGLALVHRQGPPTEVLDHLENALKTFGAVGLARPTTTWKEISVVAVVFAPTSAGPTLPS